MKRTMKARVFSAPGKIELADKVVSRHGPSAALIRMRTTSICERDVHILKGDYAVEPGLTIGHESIGIIGEVASAVSGYMPGQRVIARAKIPRSQCSPCREGSPSQCGGKPMGGKMHEAYDPFSNQGDGVLKFAITPWIRRRRKTMKTLIQSTLVLSFLISTAASGADPRKNEQLVHIRPVPDSSPIKNPVKKSKSSTERGKKTYLLYCSPCHGEDGKGRGAQSSHLNPKPSDLTLLGPVRDDYQFFLQMSLGSVGMPQQRTYLTEKERWDIVNYMRTFSK